MKEQADLLKDEFHGNLLDYQNILKGIDNNFKSHSDTSLYNLTHSNINMLLSILDKIENEYYDKLQKQIDTIEKNIKQLISTKQNI